MTTAKFRVGSREFELEVALLPEGSYLRSLIATPMRKETYGDAILLSVNDEDIPVFEDVIKFLRDGVFPPIDELYTFSYLGVNPLEDYDLAQRFENQMRVNMYKQGFENHPMNKDPHYGLVELTPELWNVIPDNHLLNPGMLFNKVPLKKRSWAEVQKSVDELNEFVSLGGVMIAGGRIFSALFGTRTNDTDLFFYGSQDPLVAYMKNIGVLKILKAHIEKVRREFNRLREERGNIIAGMMISESIRRYLSLSLVRAIQDLQQLGVSNQKIDGIVSLILQSLDLELGTPDFYATQIYIPEIRMLLYIYDPKKKDIVTELMRIRKQISKLWQSGISKITRTTNALTFKVTHLTVQVILRFYRTPSEILHGFDVDCCSMGYDGRIWLTQRALYAIWNGWNTVNFGRLSPSYERRLAKYGTRGMAVRVPNFSRERVKMDKLEKYYHEIKKPFGIDYKEVDTLRGLDTLLYLEFQLDMLKYKHSTLKAIDNIAERNSDYSLAHIKHSDARIMDICVYVLKGRNEYPMQSSRYLPLWGPLEPDFDENPDDYVINKIESVGPPENKDVKTNLIPKNAQLDFLEYELNYKTMDDPKYLNLICQFNPMLYNFLGAVRPWKIPRDITWKVINPGEQMTGTFHQLVLNDLSIWYFGRFYA